MNNWHHLDLLDPVFILKYKNIYNVLNNNEKCINIIKLAKSAQRNNMSNLLKKIR